MLNSAAAAIETAVFRALADPTRREILRSLREGERAAGAIADGFTISGPSISRHLSVLRGSGLVRERREGNRILYSLAGRQLALVVGDYLASVEWEHEPEREPGGGSVVTSGTVVGTLLRELRSSTAPSGSGAATGKASKKVKSVRKAKGLAKPGSKKSLAREIDVSIWADGRAE